MIAVTGGLIWAGAVINDGRVLGLVQRGLVFYRAGVVLPEGSNTHPL